MGEHLDPLDLLSKPHRIAPTILGVIRWAKTAGPPMGCGGFNILVEERTPTEWREGPGGIEPIPGTGIWKLASIPASCSDRPDQDDYYEVLFSVIGLDLNVLDGLYRVTPTLQGKWRHPLLGTPRIDPLNYRVSLTESNRVQKIEFEVLFNLADALDDTLDPNETTLPQG